MRLADPQALLLLLLVPPLLWWVSRRQAPVGIAYPALGELVRLPPSWPSRLRAALPWLRALALILTIFALARPQWGVEATKVQREGIAIAMVVDVSSSMGALDLQLGDRQANRLDVVKETFRAFVTGDDGALAGRDGDIIGMITFARYADALSPLTLDHDALLGLLDSGRDRGAAGRGRHRDRRWHGAGDRAAARGRRRQQGHDPAHRRQSQRRRRRADAGRADRSRVRDQDLHYRRGHARHRPDADP
jgi:von Willebrand factor type A domain/Aerotolerance regulator N-terminal